ncbi:CRISPR-associated endonuclease Cas1 [Fundidesulfovibrio magnetotacticus]|uniref:CRISPR-associated endonuclease Cas1 n=1 Tax=Fundidesulfovibrio magnetotacticus TaxID=2730080 RepID=A0A6V8LXG3_9BACT|nr:type II CRISPR-associated endonuclease Cas1 [Fundidesulfovibrio magnetotacticus]GFK95271.1 CRISPR-associated endonuclease Cas1 [Fundidesulfovibrio magnetotacticus]
MNRILDIGDRPARLNVEDGLLCVRVEGGPEARVPLAEVGALLVSHGRVVFTHGVLAGLSASGGVYVACDERHMPVGMMLPLAGNSVQTERIAAQAEASAPLRKQAWKYVVQMKLVNQAWALSLVRGHGHGLEGMAARVRSGDPGNVEGEAARKYWRFLFGANGFTRDRASGGVNAWLNYGYAVVRAVMGRAVCAAGLHPSLGLHHHNRYDAFCLVSDLMEPYRPLVDVCAAGMAAAHGTERELGKELKRELLEFLNQDFLVEGERRELFSLCAQTARSLGELYCGQRNRMFLPRFEGLGGVP